jgi:type II secretory pathway pseudopilin PulG
VLKVKPLDTLFTSYDEPFWVDIESDRDTTLDVYIYGYDHPFTSISVTKPYTRARVWSENPIASNPTNNVHKIIFKDRYTDEQVDVWIAYLSPRVERVELRPARGITLAGTVTQLIIIGDLVFYRRMGVRRFALINAPNNTKVFHEFMGLNENGKKFYFIERQDRILAILGTNTDLYVTLNPVETVPVTVEFEIPVLAPIMEMLIPAVEKDNSVIRSFISAVGGIATFITRYPIGIARFITKTLGINTDLVDVGVSGTGLRVTYLVDAGPIVLVILGLAGAVLGYAMVTAIRDIVIEREKSYRIAEITTMVTRVNEERSRVINEAISYARGQNLSPDALLSILNSIDNLYSTPDINNAINAVDELENLKRQLGEESRKKWIFALGGAGIGAAIVAVARGK